MAIEVSKFLTLEIVRQTDDICTSSNGETNPSLATNLYPNNYFHELIINFVLQSEVVG
jgi:hypothetical protein